ncbi:DUF6264 family protein [Microbacterium sp. P05]|uniref:DUF6264 family protein n=1 Tax=Microbacterium sp. P05 TaxID=3366948 RepID=UPI003744E518
MSDAGSSSDENSRADARPRPQYGEYATPEEQRARIAQPNATDALSAGESLDLPADAGPAFGTRGPVAASAQDSAEQQASTPSRPSGAPISGPRTRGQLIDSVITVFLLTYGLINLLGTVPMLLMFEQFADSALEMWGSNESFSNLATGRLWGTVAAIVLVVGWLLTAFFAWRRLRRRKLAFWVPLVGAAVTLVLITVCVTIPLVGDPAFAQLFPQMAG